MKIPAESRVQAQLFPESRDQAQGHESGGELKQGGCDDDEKHYALPVEYSEYPIPSHTPPIRGTGRVVNDNAMFPEP